MRLLTLLLIASAATIIPGCALAPTSAYKVAAGTARVPIIGKVKALSGPDLAAAVRTLGTAPIYQIDIRSHDAVVVDMQPVVEGAFQGDITTVRRLNGQWKIDEHVIITP